MARTIQVGDKVTCKVPEHAYYSGYGGQPEMVFRPGYVGTVAAIASKVRMTPKQLRNKAHDGKADFLVVDYDCPITKETQRVGLDFCNAVKV